MKLCLELHRLCQTGLLSDAVIIHIGEELDPRAGQVPPEVADDGTMASICRKYTVSKAPCSTASECSRRSRRSPPSVRVVARSFPPCALSSAQARPTTAAHLGREM